MTTELTNKRRYRVQTEETIYRNYDVEASSFDEARHMVELGDQEVVDQFTESDEEVIWVDELDENH